MKSNLLAYYREGIKRKYEKCFSDIRIFQSAITKTRRIRAIPSIKVPNKEVFVYYIIQGIAPYTAQINAEREYLRLGRESTAVAWQLNLPNSGKKRRRDEKWSVVASLSRDGFARKARRNMAFKFLSNSGDDGGTILKRITRNSCFGRA